MKSLDVPVGRVYRTDQQTNTHTGFGEHLANENFAFQNDHLLHENLSAGVYISADHRPTPQYHFIFKNIYTVHCTPIMYNLQ